METWRPEEKEPALPCCLSLPALKGGLSRGVNSLQCVCVSQISFDVQLQRNIIQEYSYNNVLWIIPSFTVNVRTILQKTLSPTRNIVMDMNNVYARLH